MNKKELIKKIKATINKHGEFTTADVIADYSPNISNDKSIYRLCESFNKNDVEVVTYDRYDEELYSDYMKYEQLTNTTLLEIYKLSKVWVDMTDDEVSKEDLINDVLTSLEDDIAVGDFTVLEELLGYVPIKNLIQSLNEDDWKKYKKLR